MYRQDSETGLPAPLPEPDQVLVCRDFDNHIRWQPGERLEQLFEQRCDQLQADGHTGHLAVSVGTGGLTYTELDRRANQTARYLLKQGIRSGDRVGLLFKKSSHTYSALLAVLKIRAAYVPLDASFPHDRIAFILEDAGVKAVVTVSACQRHVQETDAALVCLDEAEAEITAEPDGRLGFLENGRISSPLCYIIYTSGSTGKPKGVAVNHPSVCNFVRVAGEVYGVQAQDRMYQGLTIAFDFSVEEIWISLAVGATLVPGPADGNLMGQDLADFLTEHRVTALCCVPTLLATIDQSLPNLRFLLVSGEACPHDLVVRWYHPERIFLNAYGPTETTVTATVTPLHPDQAVTIGGPLPTYSMVILDEDKNAIVAKGKTGEIGIAGIGLTEGYLNRPDLTEKAFINDFLHLPNNPSRRLYRSGDLGYIDQNNQIVYQGRIDTQVKIRGYRIELSEIESVLMSLPGIAQAVVNTYESTPGTLDLVAYYSLVSGVSELSLQTVSEQLRAQLPCYMVPTYFERLDVIPMTSSHKADRKNLPAPVTRLVAETAYVAPRSETEVQLANALGEILNLERISVEDDFFQALGAHSLLMAQFSTKLRRIPGLAAVSMRDIYLNPTLEKLAAHLDRATQLKSVDESVQTVRCETLHIPSNAAYYGCGTLQLLFMTGYGAVLLWVMVECLKWLYATHVATGGDWNGLYLRIVALAVGLFTFFTALSIIAKWLLIGRWTVQDFPVWSLRYFRFWLVKGLIRTAPMVLFAGSPLYNVYLRLLGAKIGHNTVILSRLFPVTTDLVSIGSHTILRKDSLIPGYSARSNRIHTGPVSIGHHAFVGEAAVVDIHTVMENDSQLGHASSLHSGQRIPEGQHYHGSPAQVTDADYATLAARKMTWLRKGLYTALQLINLFLLGPLFLVLMLYTLSALHPYWFEYLNQYEWMSPLVAAYQQGRVNLDLVSVATAFLPISLLLFFVALPVGLIGVLILPRFFNVFLQPGKVYTLYGFHYWIHRIVVGISNSYWYNLLFGDSSYIVYYLKWLGYQLNRIHQTGSNFGTNQKHENPFLCHIGSGTMVSDGLSMLNTQISDTAFKVNAVTIGDHNYLGNNIHYPHDSQVGANCLLATKVMIPIDEPLRENTGLLGAPAFEIPRMVERDKAFASDMSEATRLKRLTQKNRHNIMTVLAYLSSLWFLAFIALISVYASVLHYPIYGTPVLIGAGLGLFWFSIPYFVVLEWASLGFKRLQPRQASVLDAYFWFHERHWKFTENPLMHLFKGTPMQNTISRLIGIKLGRKVFDDGCQFLEKTLIEVGDYTTLNQSTTIQGHSLEEGLFKSDCIKIGRGCTLGCNAFVHYGVNMGDGVCLAADSFLMKGEAPEDHSTWQGNPARNMA